MRWWSIPIVLTLGWFAYTLTPFWALYGLAGAVQAHDVDYIERHVNFRTLRLSLTRQLAATIRANAAVSESREQQRLADAAVALATPIVDALVTPQMVIDLLQDGWPQGLDLPGGDRPAGPALSIPNLRALTTYYTASDMRGFRATVIAVPPRAPRDDQFRLRLRLRGFSWRLVDIDLSESLRQQIAAALARVTHTRGSHRRPQADAPPEHDPEPEKR
ncbi:DUF2939 domain-containing protein [Methylobacterium organophilum]|uniref:DUF2939 domain-containing protein n=1 Tax=Methylobacterium organophilum TaxID=410 RepID=UPI001F13A611|nr:DUF2939 domain-containing protein [Methylobacterium organophilum]UMY17770.1 DUF2939 domain-containing protein [Methylobacterium organophilum]